MRETGRSLDRQGVHEGLREVAAHLVLTASYSSLNSCGGPQAARVRSYQAGPRPGCPAGAG